MSPGENEGVRIFRRWEVEAEKAWRGIAVAQMGYMKPESETRNVRAFNIPCQVGGRWAMDTKKTWI